MRADSPTRTFPKYRTTPVSVSPWLLTGPIDLQPLCLARNTSNSSLSDKCRELSGPDNLSNKVLYSRHQRLRGLIARSFTIKAGCIAELLRNRHRISIRSEEHTSELQSRGH